MDIDPELRSTLIRAAAFLGAAQDDWWVLGSAAMALIGIDPGGVRDVDILVSKRDAAALLTRYGLRNEADGGTDRYRSAVFLRPDLGGVDVEIMADYRVKQGVHWQPIWPQTRRHVSLDGTGLIVPGVQEQLALLRMLNRPKDHARIARLERSL
ncbi:MAG: hypothetical protein AAGA72_08990 [Pseudomonadota bacterium]